MNKKVFYQKTLPIKIINFSSLRSKELMAKEATAAAAIYIYIYDHMATFPYSYKNNDDALTMRLTIIADLAIVREVLFS